MSKDEGKKVYTQAELEVIVLKKSIENMVESMKLMAESQDKMRITLHDTKNAIAAMGGVMKLIEDAKLIDDVKTLKTEMTALKKKMEWWSGNWFKIVIAASIVAGVIFTAGVVYPHFATPNADISEHLEQISDKN